jgi:MscS family membrane protein
MVAELMMSNRPGMAARTAVLLAVVLALSAVTGIAHQAPAAKAAKAAPAPPAQQAPAPAAEAAPSATPPEDPLGRETPRGAFVRFIAATEAGNFSVAAQYLQWPRRGLSLSREEAARQLSYVLNHTYEGAVEKLSRDPAGSYSDSRPPDREWVGTALLLNGDRIDILLARTPPQNGAQVWLFSADTVAEIPRMYENSGLGEFERTLPAFLTTARFGEVSIWVPLALTVLLLVLFVASLVFLWLVSLVIRLVGRIRRHASVPARWRAWYALSRPSAFLLTLGFHRLLAPGIGIPLLYRVLYNRVSIILLLAGVVWWLWTLIDLVAESVRHKLEFDHPRTAQSMYTFGRRILKGAALALALLVSLSALGFDLSATLAGLGIGGVALAFAAQKTLENIFGGVSVLSDRSIVVGDFCKIGPHTGQVEDVGLRTTQLRTLNRTIVHVPNGALANLEVENFARRDKFFFNPAIGLRYETSLEQLQRVLTDVRKMLATDARVESDTARARFVKFGAYSLDVEIFAYVKAADYAAFLGIQEELLMRIMAIVKYAGTGLAFPSQTMYVRRDTSEPHAMLAPDAP